MMKSRNRKNEIGKTRARRGVKKVVKKLGRIEKCHKFRKGQKLKSVTWLRPDDIFEDDDEIRKSKK